MDVESETLDRHLTTARIASAAVWPFLAAASSEAEFANRKALASDRIDRLAAAVAEGDPALFSVVRASLEDGFDQDFAVLHGERVAAAQIEASKTLARKEQEAAIKAIAEREALERILATSDADYTCIDCGKAKHVGGGAAEQDPNYCKSCYTAETKDSKAEKTAAGLENLGDAKAEPFGADGKPKDDDESTEKTAKDEYEPYEDIPKDDKNEYDKRESSLRATAGDTATVSNIPNCDVCKSSKAVYDARLPGLGGSWGNVCQDCFDKHGPGQTGTGHAQKLVQASKTAAAMPSVDDIMSYEQGDMSEDDTVTFFQGLIDSGMAWKLQGSYGRTAQSLIEAGVCHAAGSTAKKTAAGEDPKMLGADCNHCGHRLVKMVTGDWADPYATGSNTSCASSPSGKHAPDRHEASKTAAFPPAPPAAGGAPKPNPFGQKKPANDGDAGAPDHAADQQGGSWACPACGSANAYTQGGVDLDEALKAKTPIQCGDCKQVDDQSAPAADPAAPPAQNHPSPGQPPVHASRHPFVQGSSSGYPATAVNTYGSQGVTLTYVSTSHPMVTASMSTSAAPFQPGIPDDMTDGPHVPGAQDNLAAPPQSTRPRVLPDTPNVPAPAAAVPGDPAAPPAAAPKAATPPPKKAAGLGFTSAAFKEKP